MKNLIRLEEAFMLGLAIYLNQQLTIAGWWFWALFLAPDIGMLGYLINPRAGAITYNLFHHKGVAIGLFLAGVFLHQEILQFTGLLLFGHSSFDRIMGYGLKYSDSFQHTHLGMIGKGAK